jgi:uncharacterized membrane protein YhaH (DUF805 family)
MFKAPFSFDGRIRRTEYGVSLIIYFVVYIGVYFGIFMAMASGGGGGSIIALVLFAPLLWFFWAQGAKRCHDIGNSGWWQLIPFYFLVMLFKDGDPGTNEYGMNAKGIGATGDSVMRTETLDGHLK